MCRILAYLGEPLPAQNLLFDTDNSLVRQSYSPRMMNTFLNLAGFGMKAWDPTSLRPEDPFSYRATTLPSFDRNLGFLSSKLAPTCLVAHVRGVMRGLNRGVRAVPWHGTHVAHPGATAFSPVAFALAIVLTLAGMVATMTSVVPSSRLVPLQQRP